VLPPVPFPLSSFVPSGSKQTRTHKNRDQTTSQKKNTKKNIKEGKAPKIKEGTVPKEGTAPKQGTAPNNKEGTAPKKKKTEKHNKDTPLASTARLPTGQGTVAPVPAGAASTAQPTPGFDVVDDLLTPPVVGVGLSAFPRQTVRAAADINRPPAPPQDDEEQDAEDFADLVVTLMGDDVEPAAVPPFQSGHRDSRSVTAMKGEDLLKLLQLSAENVPSLSTLGIVKSTRQEHQRMLRLLHDLLVQLPSFHKLPLTTAVAELLLRRRKERNWRWSTTVKYLATAHGALALLPLYRQTTGPVLVKCCPVWGQTMKAAAQRARQELPKQPRAISWQELRQVLESETNTQTFTALLIGWFTAARLGCILQLQRRDLTTNDETRTIDVRFLAGKGVKARGPYTVTTPAIPQPQWTRLVKYLSERPRHLFTMDTTGAQLKVALRRGHMENEQRSIRRGALQALALAPGMTTEILMRFSGHTQERTLMRYLNFGTKAKYQATRDRAAAGTALIALAPQ
jgi:integrase